MRTNRRGARRRRKPGSPGRREVLKKVAYSAPVIIASFFMSTAGAVPPSGCGPETCNPRMTGCNPP